MSKSGGFFFFIRNLKGIFRDVPFKFSTNKSHLRWAHFTVAKLAWISLNQREPKPFYWQVSFGCDVWLSIQVQHQVMRFARVNISIVPVLSLVFFSQLLNNHVQQSQIKSLFISSYTLGNVDQKIKYILSTFSVSVLSPHVIL